jgi:hypothetical protein
MHTRTAPIIIVFFINVRTKNFRNTNYVNNEFGFKVEEALREIERRILDSKVHSIVVYICREQMYFWESLFLERFAG